MSFSPGTRLGPYEIVQALGEGGMGVVYKALDTRLKRFAAIKVLRADRIEDADRRRRFVQEAQAASALNHPNIVTVYEIGEYEGIDYIAMEYVAGKTLDALIPRKACASTGRCELRYRWPQAWSARTPPVSCTGTSSRATLS